MSAELSLLKVVGPFSWVVSKMCVWDGEAETGSVAGEGESDEVTDVWGLGFLPVVDSFSASLSEGLWLSCREESLRAVDADVVTSGRGCSVVEGVSLELDSVCWDI